MFTFVQTSTLASLRAKIAHSFRSPVQDHFVSLDICYYGSEARPFTFTDNMVYAADLCTVEIIAVRRVLTPVWDCDQRDAAAYCVVGLAAVMA